MRNTLIGLAFFVVIVNLLKIDDDLNAALARKLRSFD